MINPNLRHFCAVVLLASLTALTACKPKALNDRSPILLFGGEGTSPNDVTAVERVLKNRHLRYTRVDSRQLNRLNEAQLATYRLVIVPGGNFLDMGRGLTPVTTERIRHAVQGGVNYLGICAGGLLAGDGSYNSIRLASGVQFRFYSATKDNIHKAAVVVTHADGKKLEHYWEDGPEFTGWGTAVAKYPDDTPAVVEGVCEKGWVVLCGFHPEAPDNWRNGMTFKTSAEDSNAYAGELIEAALNRISLARGNADLR